MKVSIVVAAAENGTIGAGGGIPWKLPDDQRHFRLLTTGHHIVMGRRTHESIGRLLPGRTTIVVSRNPDYRVPGAHTADGLDAALAIARGAGESEVFVVGGERLYALALPVAERIHLTRVHATFEGDSRFPMADSLDRAGFVLEDAEPHARDARHAHDFTFERWRRRGD